MEDVVRRTLTNDVVAHKDLPTGGVVDELATKTKGTGEPLHVSRSRMSINALIHASQWRCNAGVCHEMPYTPSCLRM